MDEQAQDVFLPDIESIIASISDPCTPFHLESTHGDLLPGSEPLGTTNFDMNSWTSTVELYSANVMQPGSSFLAELHVLIDQIGQLEEHDASNNAANPELSFGTHDASPHFQPSSLDPAPSSNLHTIPIISSEHQSYFCSWHSQDSGVQCDHVAHDRPGFLRHLGETHQVSGNATATIICRLRNFKTGVACGNPIKRGNYPRHVDTHFPLRYNCQYCPPGTSFARRDVWRKHMRVKHT